MTLRSPNLDDRDFETLLNEAKAHAKSLSGWEPSSPSDPGTVLLELFAYITDVMMYRVNRLPEKVYVELLRLIGVELHPPSAATTQLRFTCKGNKVTETEIKIPQNTRVGGSGGTTFLTLVDAAIAVGESFVDVTAIHAQWIDYTSIGQGTGKADLRIQLPKHPVIASAPSRLDLIVAVELGSEVPSDASHKYLNHEGKGYRIWREVENFSTSSEDDHVYKIDRSTGLISFAPSLNSEMGASDSPAKAIAAIPLAGRDIVARYRVGGGLNGNLPVNTLTKLIDKIPNIEVSNITRATGGSDIEELQNALIRGPLELNSLQRAVTAQDFELIASKQSGLVNRAYAYTKKTLWEYASPGTVEVILVPQVSSDQGLITPEVMNQNVNQNVLNDIQLILNERKPLGTTCEVSWCRYKSVQACVSLKVHREENRQAVQQRIKSRLNQMITPLNAANHQQGWAFGQSIGAYDIYRILSDEQGVKSVEPVLLKVNDVPSENGSYVDADPWQKNTWYTVAGDSLFRSLNNGAGWELIKNWYGETINGVKSFPKDNQHSASVAGLVVVWADNIEQHTSSLHLSRDCGESWFLCKQLSQDDHGASWRINDVAWIDRSGVPSLLVATSKGLYEYSSQEGKEWKQILIDNNDQALPVRSVVVATTQRGRNHIAVLTTRDSGVFLCSDAAAGIGFRSIGLRRESVEVLKIQYADTQRILWAGFFASLDDKGTGCKRWQLQDSGEDAPSGWEEYRSGWDDGMGAGACTSLDFADNMVLAGTKRYGVLRLNTAVDKPVWSKPNINGLPMMKEKVGVFEPVNSVSVRAVADGFCVMSTGPEGTYLSLDKGVHYDRCCAAEFNDKVTLPSTWLFCSGDHQVEVEYD